MELRYSEDAETVFLPEGCVIENAVELKAALLEALGSPRTKRVDVTGVKRIDLSGIQLLFAFLRSGNAGDRSLAWTGSFRDAAGGAFEASGYSEVLKAYRIEQGVPHDR